MTEPDSLSVPEYPEVTDGSILARKAREDANRLSNEESAELFRAGMQLIYSGSGDQTVCGRR
ncbi:MAG TPA: hypothetical protein VGD78_00980 [Chthoniobacterales bacterium]